MKRKGFTLLELLIASGVAIIAITAVGSTFISVHRMLGTTMAESELAMATRELRDKLLFNVSPTVNGYAYAGLLSGTNLLENQVWNRTAIEMTSTLVGQSLSDVKPGRIRLLNWYDERDHNVRFIINDGMPNKDYYRKWLWPGGFSLEETELSDMMSYESLTGSGQNIYRIYLDLVMKTDVVLGRKRTVYRRERVSIPVLGRLQPMRNLSGDY